MFTILSNRSKPYFSCSKAGLLLSAVCFVICPTLRAEFVAVGNPTFGVYTFTDADTGAPLACLGNMRPEVDTDSADLYKAYYNLDGSFVGKELIGSVSQTDVANIKQGKVSPKLSAKIQDHVKNPSRYADEVRVATKHKSRVGADGHMHAVLNHAVFNKAAVVKPGAQITYKKK
jgi:hypothetical protein